MGSLLVGHVAWHWMETRAADLAARAPGVGLPPVDAVFALGLMRAGLVAALALALGLAVRHLLRTFRLT